MPNCSCENKEIPNNLTPLKMYEMDYLCGAAFAESPMFAGHLLYEYRKDDVDY